MAAEKGGQEVALPVLAATLTTAIVFFPVMFLYGVSQFLFTALALAVVLSLFASYFVAMTVVPLFCAKLIKGAGRARRTGKHAPDQCDGALQRLVQRAGSRRCSSATTAPSAAALVRPAADPGRASSGCSCSASACCPSWAGLFPAHRSRTVRHQPQDAHRHQRRHHRRGRRAGREDRPRGGLPPRTSTLIVSNIGSTPGFSSMYTPNSASHTAFVQVSLNEDHRVGSYEYMDRVRRRIRARAAAAHHLFPVRRPGGRGAESRPADADRRAGERHESGSGAMRTAVETRGCDRDAFPASTTCSFRRTSMPRRCGWTSTACRQPSSGSDAEGGGQQRHHRADLQRDDRAELLGRSEERQRLSPDRAVSGRCGARQLGDLKAIPIRAANQLGADTARCGGKAQRRCRRRPKWITISCGGSSMCTSRRPTRISAS